MARGRVRKIDNVRWLGFGAQALAMPASAVGAQASSAGSVPETLLRTRGELLVAVDGAQAPGSLVRVGCGLILVPEGTGATVLWSPLTDSDAPWFWYWRGALGYEEMVTDVVDVPGMTSVREVIDSKAMRRVRNQEIQFVAENVSLSTAASVNIVINGRFLLGQ